MRSLLAVGLFFSAANWAIAQDQEQKLVDRLLKPNTTMENSAQNKKFIADRASIHKRANTGEFYVQEKAKPKKFGGILFFHARDFRSRSSAGSNDKAHLSLQQLTSQSQRSFTTSKANVARAPRDSTKVNRTRDFSGNRPFLAQGKSQKSLSRINPPMTIEQVRELLNKNK